MFNTAGYLSTLCSSHQHSKPSKLETMLRLTLCRQSMLGLNQALTYPLTHDSQAVLIKKECYKKQKCLMYPVCCCPLHLQHLGRAPKSGGMQTTLPALQRKCLAGARQCGSACRPARHKSQRKSTSAHREEEDEAGLEFDRRRGVVVMASCGCQPSRARRA